MNKSDLTAKIRSIPNAKRIYRDEVAYFVIANIETFSFLVALTFENQKKVAIKSSWVLELVCLQNINYMAADLDYFVENIDKPSNESILRPLAKICFLLTKAYYAKSDNMIKSRLTEDQKNKIIETNFDWLIDKHKVANQAFAMDTLFLFGKEYEWIRLELRLVLEKHILNGSPGYQVRANRILKKLNI